MTRTRASAGSKYTLSSAGMRLSKLVRNVAVVAAVCLQYTGGKINNSAAEVVLDGTLKGVRPGALSGPHYEIKATDGKAAGTTLFHSFSRFNIDINHGESATFKPGQKAENVIGRVTSSSPSNINGTLKVDGRADLWFINPHGVIFGQKASLEVPGSVHIGTADYLKLGNGGRYDAANPGNSHFTSDPPEAFGFLAHARSNPPGSIDIDRSQLYVPAGKRSEEHTSELQSR